MRLRVIITGATGMVGEGVLLECLERPEVEAVLAVNRKPFGRTHPKLKECVVPDFLNLDGVADQLAEYNACFYCAGVSSVGLSEADYTRFTYDTTVHFARKLAELNAQMVFVYVSGAGTDGTEKGKLAWARVKGRTENALLRLGFKSVYNFRPGFMKAMPNQRNLKLTYKLFAWLYPILRVLTPNLVSTLRDVANAMIKTVLKGYDRAVLEVKDINALAKTQ